MPSASRFSSLVLLFTATFASTLSAHDDDPKLQDLQPAFQGAGYRPGAILNGSCNAFDSVPPGGSISFPASGVRLLSWVTLSELGSYSGSDCWGYTSPSGREYALMGHQAGSTVVEVTDPSCPQIIASIDENTNLWRDIKVYQEYAYSVSEGTLNAVHFRVLDLTDVDNGVVDVIEIPSPGNAAVHNAAIDETSGFLYLCGGQGNGILIYDLAIPTQPTFVGGYSGRYVHDAQVVTYTSGPYAGRQIAYCCAGFGNGGSQTGLTVLDVTNKSNIQVLDHYRYSGAKYSHQAWLSDDWQHLFLSDELDESGNKPTTIYVFDVSDPGNPEELGSFTNGNDAISHNVYTVGDQLFAANYRSGLRVFDVSDPVNGTETAYFDTWPGNDASQFNGLWSVYPFFPSGIVIGSDLEKGLFVWWVGDPLVTLALPGGAPESVAPSGDTVAVQISEQSPGDLQASSAALYYNSGDAWNEALLTDLGGGAFEADFPPLACGTELSWFVAARSTNGVLWMDPPEGPYSPYASIVTDDLTVLFEDDMESDPGWDVGVNSDDATSGIWVRGNPIANSTQPADDHSPAGVECWYTGANSDVDNGQTTLTSPTMDLSAAGDPVVSFWMWFGKGGAVQGADRFKILVHNGSGGWELVDSIGSPALTSVGAWEHYSFHVADYLPPSDSVRVRFRINDDNIDSKVDGAVDDLRVFDAGCSCSATNFCSTSPNSAGAGALMGRSGTLSIASNNFHVEASNAVPGVPGLFYYGPDETQSPFGDGFRCVAPGAAGTHRLQPPQAVDGTGTAVRQVDFDGPPANAGSGAIFPGGTWKFQFWYRDAAAGGSGFNLSDGLSVTFCP